MAILNFIRNLVGVKADDAVQSAVDALVRWDPKAATEAELRTMEQHLDQLGMQVAQARAALNKEQKEADTIQALSRQRMAAAEQIEKQSTEATDPGRQAELEKSLGTLLGMLEQMAPEVDREMSDAKHAQEFLEMLESAYADAGGKLKAARSELGRAERDMQRASQQRQVAERQADAARQTAGLTRVTSGLSVALKSMQDSASKDLAAAEAAAAKTRLLKPTKPEQDDPNIAKAMQAASGVTPPQSMSERLAALKAKH
jgi:chromosome segregation ATPase